MKPHVLLDIAILGHAFDLKTSSRGVERLVMALFDGLQNRNDCEVSFVATASLAGTHDFLRANGIVPEEKLKFSAKQFPRSRKAQKFSAEIHSTENDRTLPARVRRKILSLIVSHLNYAERFVETDWLAGADIYHTPHTNHPLLPFPNVILTNRHIKKFITIHDLMVVKYPEIFGNAIQPYFKQMRACFSEETFAFCASENVRQDILEMTPIRAERIFLAPLAADRQIFFPSDGLAIREAKEELGIPATPYFLALSVPEAHKNFAHVIRCFAELARGKELKDQNLVIVGRNAARNPLVTKSVQKYPELAKRIYTPGFVPDEKLAAIYSGATAFLFPSLVEGFGLPPLEAMQCGVPVISSNTTSMPEVVGEAGILLAPTDVDGWCQAMLNVSQNEKLRTELKTKSIERAKMFSWERHVDAVVAGYHAAFNFND